MEEVSEIVVPLSVVDGEEEVLLVIVMLRLENRQKATRKRGKDPAE